MKGLRSQDVFSLFNQVSDANLGFSSVLHFWSVLIEFFAILGPRKDPKSISETGKFTRIVLG